VLEVRDVRKSFDGFQAVGGVSLKVERGQIAAIIGPNGAGKTTFFNLVTGHLRPDAGTVVLDGRDITGLAPHDVCRLGMGRSFQRTNIFPKLTVYEQLELGIALASEPSLLLLDEPTAGMSATETRETIRLVERIARERGLTLLFTEHDMDVVFSIAQRITVLHQGRVIAEGSPAEVRADPEVRRVYLGERR